MGYVPNTNTLGIFPWNLNSGGTPSLALTTGGNIGIGTASPRNELDVWGGAISATGPDLDGTAILTSSGGTAYLSNNTLGNGLAIDSSGNVEISGDISAPSLTLGGVTRSSWPSGGGTSQWTTSGSNINYAGGNVGIGVASPAAKLEVNGDEKLDGVLTCLQGVCPPNNVIRLTPNLHLNSGAGYAVIANWDNGTTGGSQAFRVGNGAGTGDAFYVTANGDAYATHNINAGGTVTVSGNQVYVGGTGNLYGDGANLALRAPIGGAVYIQNTSGGAAPLCLGGSCITSWPSGGSTYSLTVTRKTVTHSANTNAIVAVTCDSGSVTGGGMQGSPSWGESYPSAANTWTCDGSYSATWTCYAVCAQ